MKPMPPIKGPRLALFSISMVCLSFMITACSDRSNDQERDSQAANAGHLVYLDYCAECHEKPQPDLLKQPPNLHGLFSGKILPSGAPATDRQVRSTIIDGRATMPAFEQRLQKDEVDELVAYLHTLK